MQNKIGGNPGRHRRLLKRTLPSPLRGHRRLPDFQQGVMLEWLKRHAWKACIRQKRIPSSNLGH
ncbi:MAG: hypothetical protein K2G53_03390, partial [Muribaculaceae bacterium]|nr:hypothetical protein [Muribaculaceae bacterium]